jgi:hypothetical protein
MHRQHFPKTTVGLSQWIVLIQRNFRVIFADKPNLSLIFLQVPLIAMLIIVAFYHFDRDKQSFDEAARILYYFGVMKEPLQQADKTINIDTLHRYAKTLALEMNIATRHDYIQKTIKPFFERKNVPLPDLTFTYVKEEIQFISDIASIRRGSVYFLLVAASIWFGIMGSCKEIVTERPLLKRESRSYLFISPYLSAKFFVLTIIFGLTNWFIVHNGCPIVAKIVMDGYYINLAHFMDSRFCLRLSGFIYLICGKQLSCGTYFSAFIDDTSIIVWWIITTTS